MTWILGLNAYHGDAAACLLHDGELVAAAEEERFRRLKHWAGFPALASAWCLSRAGIGLEDVTHVAVNRDPRAERWQRVLFALRHRPSLSAIWARLKNRRRLSRLEAQLLEAFPGQRLRARIERIEHHLAHLASAAYVAPFEESLAVSVDQFGDFSSTAWGPARGSSLRVEGRVRFPHSLGTFYSALTQLLGFPHYGDEYKLMGLAPYGRPTSLALLRQVLVPGPEGTFSLDLRYFRHHRERVYFEWDGGAPRVDELFTPELERLLGVPRRAADAPLEDRHRDLAASVQARYEEALFTLLRALHRRYGTDCLALAGGCAMNSVANGKITDATPFKRVYVQAAAGDSGGALGAALVVHHRLTPGRRWVMRHAYHGPEFTPGEIEAVLSRHERAIQEAGCTVERFEREDALCRATAKAIMEAKVVGWFQGRMEWGPRALGNRSIICDPRRADMKALLNAKIKRRESFRPFAPSVLEEAVPEWFERVEDVPFMTHVFPIRSEKRAVIPAVTHVDGSGRLQTVRREDNPRYHALISAFRDLTGVPMVLNTSFNENEPVVCRPEEALDCFLRTRMDVLVLGEHFLSRGSERRDG